MVIQGAEGSQGSRPRVGVVGGGQLARMMYQAAIPLDVDLVILTEEVHEGAGRIAPRLHEGGLCALSLERLGRDSDIVTFDHEKASPSVVAALEQTGVIVRPGASTLALAADKLAQRRLLTERGFPVPPFAEVATISDVERFAAGHGWPLVLKAPRGAYDGRGVHVVRTAIEASAVLDGFGSETALVEPQLDLRGELAVLVARRPAGESVVYPAVDTLQVSGICREVVAPSNMGDAVTSLARSMARDLADAVDAVGILAVEFFVTDGGLMVNELAPRPHNSGHYTIEGCVTSQFANHLRAVLDWPLGSTALTGPEVAMVNIIAEDDLDVAGRVPLALDDPTVGVHLYGKRGRPGRKVAHVTAVGEDRSSVLCRARRAAELLTGSSSSDLAGRLM